MCPASLLKLADLLTGDVSRSHTCFESNLSAAMMCGGNPEVQYGYNYYGTLASLYTQSFGMVHVNHFMLSLC